MNWTIKFPGTWMDPKKYPPLSSFLHLFIHFVLTIPTPYFRIRQIWKPDKKIPNKTKIEKKKKKNDEKGWNLKIKAPSIRQFCIFIWKLTSIGEHWLWNGHVCSQSSPIQMTLSKYISINFEWYGNSKFWKSDQDQ